MNLYVRLIWVLLSARFKKTVSMFEEYRSSHIVWPNDIDLFGHMNNGRYFTVTDLDRMAILMRSGIWQAMRRAGQYPVMAGETIQFRRSLAPFGKYTIRTRLIGWDRKFFYVEHSFEQAGQVAALGMVKVRVVGNGNPQPSHVLGYVYSDVPASDMSEVIETWNSSSDEHWTETQQSVLRAAA